MSDEKKLDWDAFTKAPTTTKGKYSSYQEFLAAQAEQKAGLQKSQQKLKDLEPMLRKSLADHMLSRKPIKVINPIIYHADNVIKSETSASYGFTEEVIPFGTELIFSHTDKTMGTWIFKSKGEDKEYEIFNTPVITMPGNRGQNYPIRNPAFYGLLFNTNIKQDLMDILDNED